MKHGKNQISILIKNFARGEKRDICEYNAEKEGIETTSI